MGAGRPPKKGLSYHSSDVDYYEDYKIIDLLDKYGPAGVVIYDVILKMIYRNGYYLEIPQNNLALSVTKTIGSKWIRNKALVLQVVQYCADIGLFDKDLSLQSVLTSAGIQKRYELATVRNKVHKEKYWLLKEESGKPLLNAPKNAVSATENVISATEIRNTGAEIPIKENEINIYISAFSSRELENAFQLYLMNRKYNGDILTEEQIYLLRENLLSISSEENEQIAIVKKATMSNWKSFYPLVKKKKEENRTGRSNNKFNNIEGHEYDLAQLEKALLQRK